MKKLKFNSTLNHKQNDYQTYEVEIEKVVTLYGVQFEDMKNHILDDNPWIDENRDLMYIDDNHTAHCILFLDSETGDGIITEAEGFRYARKSQFIPNAKALLDSSEMTAAEIKLHNGLKRITDMISEYAHCGETEFDFEEMLEKSDMDLKLLLRNSVIEMLQSREDIAMAEATELGIPLQPDIKVEAKEMQPLTFYCPLHIVTESDEEYDWDEEVMDEMEEIPPECALGCEDEINSFIKNYSEPEEANRGLMVYFDDSPSISEKVFSMIPSVREVDGKLMGVFECQVSGKLTSNELEELRDYATGQSSDGWGEGLEQRAIKTADYGEIYVSFWKSDDSWSLKTEEEMNFNQLQSFEMRM